MKDVSQVYLKAIRLLGVSLSDLVTFQSFRWYNGFSMRIVNIDEIKKKITPILKEEGVTRAALFGSVVRGEVTKGSDIDILVDLPRGKSLFDLAGLQMRLEEELGNEVDLITYNSINPLLRDYILKDHLPIL